jgi:hypothetical protein
VLASLNFIVLASLEIDPPLPCSLLQCVKDRARFGVAAPSADLIEQLMKRLAKEWDEYAIQCEWQVRGARHVAREIALRCPHGSIRAPCRINSLIHLNNTNHNQ